MNRLETEFLGFTMKNPIIAASGTFGYGEEFRSFYDPSLLGGISSKGLTLYPKEGNSGIRIWETPSGILNSIGLENPSVGRFLEEEYKRMRAIDSLLVVNLGGNTLEEYVEGARLLDEAEIDVLELNISCPNVKEGGMAFGVDPKSAEKITKAVRKATKHKLMVKLSPNVTHIGDMAKACEEAGADAISLINTLQGMAIDVDRKKVVFDQTYAGLSGPAVRPIALRMVHQAVKAVNIPVVGMGGIASYKDALSFLMAGAAAVMIGTVQFVNPYLGKELVEDLDRYCEKENLMNIGEIRGIV